MRHDAILHVRFPTYVLRRGRVVEPCCRDESLTLRRWVCHRPTSEHHEGWGEPSMARAVRCARVHACADGTFTARKGSACASEVLARVHTAAPAAVCASQVEKFCRRCGRRRPRPAAIRRVAHAHVADSRRGTQAAPCVGRSASRAVGSLVRRGCGANHSRGRDGDAPATARTDAQRSGPADDNHRQQLAEWQRSREWTPGRIATPGTGPKVSSTCVPLWQWRHRQWHPGTHIRMYLGCLVLSTQTVVYDSSAAVIPSCSSTFTSPAVACCHRACAYACAMYCVAAVHTHPIARRLPAAA